MSIQHWLYVSRINMAPIERAEQMETILSSARAKNERAGISGCLVMTKTHFAQWLEGPAEALARTRDTILADPRHADTLTLSRGGSKERQFGAWSLGYAGPSPLVSRHVMQPVKDAYSAHPRSAWRLLKIMRELSGEMAPKDPPSWGFGHGSGRSAA